jgi:hypothetical protein
MRLMELQEQGGRYFGPENPTTSWFETRVPRSSP